MVLLTSMVSHAFYIASLEKELIIAVDFPWASLGNSLVVDVGGGVGGFPLQLSRTYPDLRFEVQDRGPVIKQGLEGVWPKENPDALKDGRIKFTEHSFFEKNPTEGADIYILRLVL